MKKKSLTYKDAGVDIEAGEKLVDKIKPFAKKTFDENVLAGIGGFGAGYKLPKGYKEPVLVSGTDGVGTKLKVAQMANVHNTVGIDLVAMCVNDILTVGAKPLFFLDYFATGKLSVDTAADVVKGIAKGCEIAGCSLIGGETAEMPDFYPEGEYDLAGFVVGIVDKEKYITGEKIEPGDVVLGLASSGIHSNGYSLVRKLFFEILELKIDEYIKELDKKVYEVLLTPTKIYVKPVLKLLEEVEVKGIAHITGGGIPGNLVRILPKSVDAVIKKGSWEVLPIFEFIQKKGNIVEEEMFKTFNMGIGLCIVVSSQNIEKAEKLLTDAGEKVYRIGEIRKGTGKVIIQ
ncbi:phosphoribosylformylglycinamidine cyclo-ligase [Desulfurobacterium thermolithotrophum DSM 11699]|uniref:Phosphoribosylformylglycinamidine cyclo-ligase n=1 Tax=Desulfurobacterium thermolithotrophum (strain DSM 11699 / BSA) TaxID=868864 RepID=F0S0M9_DESTD|nr:phosphoribosylformylglycinamidine cyclo-ligase [Desulfurobacterium thermolithotrophum]ADY73832.1 phosphoribosylformylglycinamidine cyclo-ligase [Desulfurobacterium thermolithotrophum DSM 11699]